MSIIYCDKHDHQWDSDNMSECPRCEIEDEDKYGNPTDGSALPFCCFPDCGCYSARVCMAESGAHIGALLLNRERGSKQEPT